MAPPPPVAPAPPPHRPASPISARVVALPIGQTAPAPTPARSLLAAAPLLAAEDVPWTEIPGVRILGAILGAALLIAAIRTMFGGKG